MLLSYLYFCLKFVFTVIKLLKRREISALLNKLCVLFLVHIFQVTLHIYIYIYIYFFFSRKYVWCIAMTGIEVFLTYYTFDNNILIIIFVIFEENLIEKTENSWNRKMQLHFNPFLHRVKLIVSIMD